MRLACGSAGRSGVFGAATDRWAQGLLAGSECWLKEIAEEQLLLACRAVFAWCRGAWQSWDCMACMQATGTAGACWRVNMGVGCSHALAKEGGLVQCTCALREGEGDSKLVRWFGANMQAIRTRGEETAAEPYVEES